MAPTDSALDSDDMARLKRLLGPPKTPQPRVWPALAAAAFAAICAMSLAVAMVMAPPTVVQHPLERPG